MIRAARVPKPRQTSPASFFMSIRLRLTLWYSAVLAVMLIVLGGGIYASLVRSVNANVDAQLKLNCRSDLKRQ